MSDGDPNGDHGGALESEAAECYRGARGRAMSSCARYRFGANFWLREAACMTWWTLRSKCVTCRLGLTAAGLQIQSHMIVAHECG